MTSQEWSPSKILRSLFEVIKIKKKKKSAVDLNPKKTHEIMYTRFYKLIYDQLKSFENGPPIDPIFTRLYEETKSYYREMLLPIMWPSKFWTGEERMLWADFAKYPKDFTKGICFNLQKYFSGLIETYSECLIEYDVNYLESLLNFKCASEFNDLDRRKIWSCLITSYLARIGVRAKDHEHDMTTTKPINHRLKIEELFKEIGFDNYKTIMSYSISEDSTTTGTKKPKIKESNNEDTDLFHDSLWIKEESFKPAHHVNEFTEQSEYILAKEISTDSESERSDNDYHKPFSPYKEEW